MLKIIYTLFLLAIIKIYDLNINNYWSHNLSDGSNFQQRVDILTDNSNGYAEIIYRGDCNLQKATDAWNNSETHNAIMQNEDYKYAILIMIPKEDGGCYVEVVYKME